MKKRIFIYFGIISILLAFLPFFSFEAFVSLSGRLYIDKPGYILIKEKDDYIYYSNGNITEYLTEDEIPNYVFEYLIGLEDQNFYNHKGYDIKRIVKSLIDNTVSNKIVGGGSTITQQLARILYLNNEKSYARKLEELYYARRIENSLSKKEIITLYLNSAYFGENLYGFEKACQSYFACSGKFATKQMSIFLLSLLPSPNNYSPRKNINTSKIIYEKAIDNLYYRHYIKIDEISELKNNYPYKDNIENKNNPNISYYQAIADSLNKKQNLRTNSFEINPFLDVDFEKDIYRYAKECVTEKDAEVSIVVMEPNTFKVKALIGGINDFSFNRAIFSNKIIGSVIKPILYTIALEHGVSPLTKILSKPTTFYLENGVSYSPKNAGNKYANRNITMVEAIATSDNIYSTKIGLLLGSKMLKNRLAKVVIDIEENVSNYLGSISTSLIKITSIYNSLASGGIYQEPIYYSSYKINRNEKKNETNKIQLFNPKESLVMCHLLRASTDPCFNSYTAPTMLYYPVNKKMAIKTGTVDSASFVIGFTPYATIGVYVGKDDDQYLNDKKAAKRLFQKVANRVNEKNGDAFFKADDLTPFQLYNSANGIKSNIYYY